MTECSKKILAVLSDLMFTVKIKEAAKRVGLETIFVRSQQDALLQAKQQPAVIILDLNHAEAGPLDTIAKLKTNAETSGISLLGYVSHVDVALKKAAQEKGCDQVIARSAFSQNMPAILGRYAQL
jgi:PleD family two-component response regulator